MGEKRSDNYLYPQAYLDYLIYFHAQRDYFECHEVLEEHWKEEENPDLRKKVWVGLIQIAVALYHQRRGNFSGAQKMMNSALTILAQEKDELEKLEIDVRQLLEQLKERLEAIQNKTAYESLDLPLKEDLRQKCLEVCQARKLNWGKPSDLTNKELINKHTLRDRSDVITERERQKKLRENESRD